MQLLEVKSQKIPQETLDLILGFYEDDIRYLKEAYIEPLPKNNPGEKIRYAGSGKFSIPQCYYLKDKHGSSHFNAADFVMCFNQFSYTFVADLVRREMAPEMGVDVEGFKGGMDGSLIAKCEMTFRKPIKPDNFFGSIFMEKIRKGNSSTIHRLNVVFEDNYGGYSEGKALMVFLLGRRCGESPNQI